MASRRAIVFNLDDIVSAGELFTQYGHWFTNAAHRAIEYDDDNDDTARSDARTAQADKAGKTGKTGKTDADTDAAGIFDDGEDPNMADTDTDAAGIFDDGEESPDGTAPQTKRAASDNIGVWEYDESACRLTYSVHVDALTISMADKTRRGDVYLSKPAPRLAQDMRVKQHGKYVSLSLPIPYVLARVKK